MTNFIELQELADEANARYGDPRVCPAHGVATSSADGMHDAPCWKCEGEMLDEAALQGQLAQRAERFMLRFDRFERGFVDMTFSVIGDDEVEVTTYDSLDGEVVEGTVTMTRAAARNVWRCQLAAGFDTHFA